MDKRSGDFHVVFGTGPLGMAVTRELVRLGKQVRVVNTTGKAAVPGSAEVARGDAYSKDSVRALTAGAAAVYQCAAPPYHQWPEKFPLLQSAILEGTAANRACLIVAENLYMYGKVNGRIHEGLPSRPHTRKGRTRAQMAEEVLTAHASGKVRAAIGRGSDFFGPGVLSSTMGERAIVPALMGKTAQLVGTLDFPHTYTFVEDFGRALALLGTREEALGQVWHVPNDRPDITQRELMTIFFEEIRKPPRMKGMGKLMMSIGGLFIAGARETVEMMYEFEAPFVVDSGKFEKTFQAKATPIRQAVRQTIEWYRERQKQQK